jgi:serine/threonine-protein kinase
LLAYHRRNLPTNSVELGHALSLVGGFFLERGNYTEAEPLLHECLAIRQVQAPDELSTAMTQFMLGSTLLKEHRLPDAEQALLQTIQSLNRRELKGTVRDQLRIRRKASEQLLQLYIEWDKPDQAAEWRKKVAELPATPPSPSAPQPARSDRR